MPSYAWRLNWDQVLSNPKTETSKPYCSVLKLCHFLLDTQELYPESFPHTMMWVKGRWETTLIQHLQRREENCYWEQKARCMLHGAPWSPTELSSLLRDLIPGPADAKAVDKEKSRVQNSHKNSSVTINIAFYVCGCVPGQELTVGACPP